MNNEQAAYIAALRAQIVSLEARREHARGYSLNTQLQLEAQLLRAQIQALQTELQRAQENASC